MKIPLIKIWRWLIIIIFIFAVVHFLKDLTQDILKISTPIDLLGDVKEDISFLPQPLQYVYIYGLGGLSIVAEFFLIVAIPKVWRKKELMLLDIWILASVIFLILFFVTAISLDPRYNIF